MIRRYGYMISRLVLYLRTANDNLAKPENLIHKQPPILTDFSYSAAPDYHPAVRIYDQPFGALPSYSQIPIWLKLRI